MHPDILIREQQTEEGIPVYWGRATIDGYPFLGVPSLLREEEYNLRVRRVGIFRNGWFDLSKEDHNRKYKEILTRIINRRSKLVLKQPPNQEGIAYLEWIDYYMADLGMFSQNSQNTKYPQLENLSETEKGNSHVRVR